MEEPITPGTIVTVTDASGEQTCATFHLLQNGGSGNGVLLELNLDARGMPKFLAFGDATCEPVEGAATPTWAFRSYVRMDPPLRGTPLPHQPSREVLHLTRPS